MRISDTMRDSVEKFFTKLSVVVKVIAVCFQIIVSLVL